MELYQPINWLPPVTWILLILASFKLHRLNIRTWHIYIYSTDQKDRIVNCHYFSRSLLVLSFFGLATRVFTFEHVVS